MGVCAAASDMSLSARAFKLVVLSSIAGAGGRTGDEGGGPRGEGGADELADGGAGVGVCAGVSVGVVLAAAVAVGPTSEGVYFYIYFTKKIPIKLIMNRSTK